jgi:DNA ligase-associated metallophosphoesterase
MTADVEVAGERLVLRPDRSLFWPRAGTLVIADPHFGKADAFRAAGVPVPGGAAEPLGRLAGALAETGADRLVVLGDFWHARAGLTPAVAAELGAWRAARPGLRVALVRGNHDRAGPPPDGWGGWADHLADPPFVFTHAPGPVAGGYVLAGHLHPGVVLAGRGRDRLRLPCFWVGRRVGVVPAFARFTGAAPVPARPGDRVFAVTDTAVIEVPAG